jgi:hypothetical protein
MMHTSESAQLYHLPPYITVVICSTRSRTVDELNVIKATTAIFNEVTKFVTKFVLS